MLALGFPGGAVATLTSVWHDVLSRPSVRYIEVICERAWFAVESDWTGPLRVMTSASPSPSEVGPGELPEPVNPDGAFVRAARAGQPPSPDFEMAVRAHEVVDALYRSALQEGRRQPLHNHGEGCQAPLAAS